MAAANANFKSSFPSAVCPNGGESLQAAAMQSVGINDAPPQPAARKIQRGNGPFHANEIEYVSQNNGENRRPR